MLVIRSFCVFSTPTFAIKLNSKVMEAFLVNPPSTLGNGRIQVGPIDGPSEICNHLGKWSGLATAVSEAAYRLELWRIGFLQCILWMVLFSG